MEYEVIEDMNRLRRMKEAAKNAVVRFRRKYIPYLVFYGQELDVGVTWKENKLQPTESLECASKQLKSGRMHEIERMMLEIGVSFDKGLGVRGRDWEWDWSLEGPISVRFRAPCKTKNKRR